MAKSEHRATATRFIGPRGRARTAQAPGTYSLGAHRGAGGGQRRAEGGDQAGSSAQGGQLRGGRHGSHQGGVPVPKQATAHGLSSAHECVASSAMHQHGERCVRGWQQHVADDVHDAAAGGDVGHGHAHGVDGAAHKDARCILDDGEALAACRPGRGIHQMRSCMISARMASYIIDSRARSMCKTGSEWGGIMPCQTLIAIR